MSPPSSTNSRLAYMARMASRAANATICWVRLDKKGSAPTRSAPTRCWRIVANEASISLGMLALRMLWLRRHTTALAFGLVMRGARSFQAFEVYEYKESDPRQHEKCSRVELRLPSHTARSPTPSVGRCRTARACTKSTCREPQQG